MKVFVGIDDTDMPGTRGTNQIAKQIAAELPAGWFCELIVRHQLLFDPRVPYTSRNGSASLTLTSEQAVARGSTAPVRELSAVNSSGDSRLAAVAETCRRVLRENFVEGSDPGLCMTAEVPAEIIRFGQACQQDLVQRADAEALARTHGVHLEGLGGTCGGVIGALAAVGLAIEGNDGRVVHLGSCDTELSGLHPAESIISRGVQIREMETGDQVTAGMVDVGKKLRPNRRAGATVLFVRRNGSGTSDPHFRALKLH